MHLAIDISQVVYSGTGVARFTRGLIETIVKHENKHSWSFFFSALRQELPMDLRQKIESQDFALFEYKLPPRILSFLWNDLHVLKVEKLIKNIDWFITSDWTEPPSDKKKATIIHDVAFMRYPQTVPALVKQTHKKRLRWVKEESKLIFADSQSTKDDLIQLFDISETKLQVNYPGIEVSRPTPQITKQTLEKYDLKKPFILSVGKIEPRKNLKRLIQAFEKLNIQDAELVIVGPSGWDTIKKSENVRLLGYLDDDELYALYTSCLFFAYPSLYEGFGYPVIEAMSLGAPVVTSKTSSLGEIAKDAALLFDPEDVSEISDSMSKLLKDGDVRSKLKNQGLARGKQFTWEKYYTKLIKTLEEY